MKKIAATIIKEWQLMRRDISGLLLLLVMPVALIIIMALIQDAPFRDYREFRFALLVCNNDHGSLSRQIINGLKTSGNFRVVDSIDGQPVSGDQLTRLLSAGKYQTGITIPDGFTAEIVNSANIVADEISRKAGMDAHLPAREVREQVHIRLYFDPVSRPAFRTAINLALDKYISYSCSSLLLQRLSDMNRNGSATSDSSDETTLRRVMQGVSVEEEPLGDNAAYMQHISSVQHNVPAWAIFGMFFIVIPIAGHSIREREEGSALRIRLIPYATHYAAAGKIIFYTLVCAVQFLLMLCVGLWAMPLFGLPALNPGLHATLLAPLALCIGFAAAAYGFFVGALFRTINQALPFGAVSVVILSAIGGIWVPIEIMPHALQVIATASPMHWALEAVNDVMLRNSGAGAILMPASCLICAGMVLLAVGTLAQRWMGNGL